MYDVEGAYWKYSTSQRNVVQHCWINPFIPRVSYAHKNCSKVFRRFESVDEILWCDHSNETSSAVLSCGTVHIYVFSIMKFGICLEFWQSWEWKGQIVESQCISPWNNKSLVRSYIGKALQWAGIFDITIRNLILINWIDITFMCETKWMLFVPSVLRVLVVNCRQGLYIK